MDTRDTRGAMDTAPTMDVLQRPARILLVDGTHDLREAFQMLLEDEGYQVFTLLALPDNLAEVERLEPDLVIFDVSFGEEQACWQRLVKLRLRRATAQVPMIVCMVDEIEIEEQQDNYKALGVRAVGMPFDVPRMLETIKRVAAPGSVFPMSRFSNAASPSASTGILPGR